jgi:predicted ATPase/class 3 adenylate cyclase/Tfp pilus assembly protein PilF
MPNPTTSPLTIQLFGPLDVQCHGAPLPRLRSRNGLWLLALLTLRHGREVERTWLAGNLWPDTPTSQGLALLRRELTDLRRALGPEAWRLCSPTPRTLRLELPPESADVVSFDAAIARGDASSISVAVELRRGPLLEGCTEEWVFQERQVREEAYLAALERLAAEEAARGEHGAAVRYLRLAVGAEPLRESAQRGLMEALAASGEYGAATLVYRELRDLLHLQLNAEPAPETAALYQQIRAEARHRAQAMPPAAAAAGSPPVARRLAVEGTLTFLMTDIAGSTRLWEEQPDAMREALARHDALLTACIEAHDGTVLKSRGEGDSFFTAFARASDAVAAACTLQRELGGEPWPTPEPLRVRVALHTGEAELREGDYYGATVNRCARLRAVAHGGQILLTGATQELVQDDLPAGAALRDLGTHRLRDLQRPERVFQITHPDLPADWPPLASLDARPNNLPQQVTTFIGREQEMVAVKRLLESARLLTLTGAGGTGKTRLALQAAAELLQEYPDGVWLVELAPLAEPALVPQTVATVLGVREQPGQSLTSAIVEAVQPRRLLLVLDNCEHLLVACAQLADTLLHQCPQVKLLASSRESLGITGEQTYRVPSLTLPDVRRLPPVGRLIAYEAVRLFIDRAVLSQPTFTLTTHNAPAVAQVCHRLDGIPLAIELAAARVKALAVEQIAARLDDRFRLLTGGSRTALPRQQTLRALIDWSYNLLMEEEQVLLRRLAVFAGGWTLEAAEVVAAGEGIGGWDVLDLLTQLVEKSLVQYDGAPPAGWSGGAARYRLLETVRQYARDRLLETEESEAVCRRHLDCFLALAEQAESELLGERQRAWFARLLAEHENIRAALAWGVEQAPTTALQLAAALWRFWNWGYATEGCEVFERGLARAMEVREEGQSALPIEVRTKALRWAGWLAYIQGEPERAHRRLEESLVLSRALGDKGGTAHTLHLLGTVVEAVGDAGAARSHLEESLTIRREIGDHWGTGASLQTLGVLLLRGGDLASAQARFEESLAIKREGGDRAGVAFVLESLGDLALVQGAHERARGWYEESLSIYHDLGHVNEMHVLVTLGQVARRRGDYAASRTLLEANLALARERSPRIYQVARTLVHLGLTLIDQGDLAGARPHLMEALRLSRESTDRSLGAQALAGLSALSVAQGREARAARLLGAAERLREEIQSLLPLPDCLEYNRTVASARRILGEAALTAAWAEGRTMALDDAIRVALEESEILTEGEQHS